MNKLQELEVDYVILAGYMRVIGSTLLTVFQNRSINIHPSLLPAFPGKDAIGQAYRAGVEEVGVTIHDVDAGVDTGPIIAERAIQLAENDSMEAVDNLIPAIEHIFYPETLEALFNK